MKVLWEWTSPVVDLVSFDLALLWEPRDLWIGFDWKKVPEADNCTQELSICIIPCFPIRIRRWSFW